MRRETHSGVDGLEVLREDRGFGQKLFVLAVQPLHQLVLLGTGRSEVLLRRWALALLKFVTPLDSLLNLNISLPSLLL